MLSPLNGARDTLSIIDEGLHSYVELSRFPRFCNSLQTVALASSCGLLQDSTVERPWNETRRVINKVHKHTSGHASYSDMRTLLMRNKFWSESAQQYLAEIIERCEHCVASSTPPPSRKVALGSLNRSLNDLVLVNHFFLDDVKLFHAMDSHTRYSAAVVVPDTSLENAADAFETGWISQFWPPSQVQGDQAFKGKYFLDYLSSQDIEYRPVPSRRHHKNAIEPKHRVIRSIFLQLKSSAPTKSPTLLALSAVRISNDLYGSDTLSAFEMAKGYTKPISSDSSCAPVHEEIIRAHDILVAKRKLNKILPSKSTADPKVQPGDLVQVFVRKEKEKRGKWLSARAVLSTDVTAGSVTVPDSNGKNITAAVEDTRHAIVDDDLAASVVESIDLISDSIDDFVSCLDDKNSQLDEVGESTNDGKVPDDEHAADDRFVLPSVGNRLEVFWPIDQSFYPGTVSAVDADGHHISYDDGDEEVLKLNDEVWRVLPAKNASFPLTQLDSTEQDVLKDLFETFGNKSFMRYHAQGFLQAVFVRSYDLQEVEFCKRVKLVAISDVPSTANVI